jgi:hypothetical protein
MSSLILDELGVEVPLKWQRKAAIQRLFSKLPASELLYYGMQRGFGSLRRPPDPWPNLTELAKIVFQLGEEGFSVAGKRVMEVGTGRRLDMPLGFYLCGAESVASFDLHPYLRQELVLSAIASLLADRRRVVKLLEPVAKPQDVEARLDKLAQVKDMTSLSAATNIQYHSPADAASTGLPPQSIDLQFSYTVFEHIPREVLAAILRECSRLLSPDGIACHHIDPSDHFAHEDQSISLINFLRFEDREWKHFHDNQYAWHNRMRKDDYDRLYAEVDHQMFRVEYTIDARSLLLLQQGFPVSTAFRDRAPEILATVVYRVFSRPNRQGSRG